MVQCIELLQATTTEMQAFTKSLGTLNGGVDVLIHPFYSEETTPTKNKRYIKKEYLEKRDSFIKRCFTDGVPLIIFQQELDYSVLFPRLEVLGASVVYTVKTVRGQHYPVVGNEGWDRFITILVDSGITHVKLGGMFLVNYTVEDAVRDFEPKYDAKSALPNYVKNIPIYTNKYPYARKWIAEGIAPKGCVGFAAMEFLNSGLDVILTSVTTPCSGSELIS